MQTLRQRHTVDKITVEQLRAALEDAKDANRHLKFDLKSAKKKLRLRTSRSARLSQELSNRLTRAKDQVVSLQVDLQTTKEELAATKEELAKLKESVEESENTVSVSLDHLAQQGNDIWAALNRTIEIPPLHNDFDNLSTQEMASFFSD